MGNIGPMEIGIVLVIALIVFGPKKLPELGSSLGKGIREFKGSISGEGAEQGSADDEKTEEPKQAAIAAPTPAPPSDSASAEPAREKQRV